MFYAARVKANALKNNALVQITCDQVEQVIQDTRLIYSDLKITKRSLS